MSYEVYLVVAHGWLQPIVGAASIGLVRFEPIISRMK
jgi:hypothetical protein